MRFVDYKCNDCEAVCEIVLRSDNGSEIVCAKCGSSNMVRVFAPIGIKSSSNSSSSNEFSSDLSSSKKSCSGSSCSTCSGCS